MASAMTGIAVRTISLRMAVTWDQLELPWDDLETAVGGPQPARAALGTFAECPMCGGALAPEHAHYRCGAFGWRDSCCD